MGAAHLLTPCLFSPVLFPRRLSRLPAFRVQRRRAPFVAIRRQKPCLACGADTLVARSEGSSQALPSDKVRAEGAELKSWLHQHGLPPCKVDLKERPSHDGKHHPIHYVVASEDLQVGFCALFIPPMASLLASPLFIHVIFDFSRQAGDLAFSVPNSLVVTLDRVLGNETIGESAR